MCKDFKEFISGFFAREGKYLTSNIKDILCAPESLEVFRQAFTTSDYEIFEQIGDVIISQFIVCYSYKKFSNLRCKEGVKIVARIRIKYTSCQFLSKLAEELEFWPQVRFHETEQFMEITESRRQSILEDVFEAFIGSISCVVDDKFGLGVGYIVCNHILSSIYEKQQILLTYENLFDAKTRLKELSDFFKQKLTITWKVEKTSSNSIKVLLTYSTDGTTSTLTATARTKAEAEQALASEALEKLKILGIAKNPPEIFQNDILFK